MVVDPAKIPGSVKDKAYVRVLASDGYNTGKGQNKTPFSVLGKPPTVYIDSPAAGQSFGYGEILPLKGYGFDLEDGQLPESAFRWEYKGSQLGNGSAIEVVRLGPGDHVITLIGMDSEGMTGTARIKIHISFL